MSSRARSPRLPYPTHLGFGYLSFTGGALILGQLTGNLTASALGFGLSILALTFYLLILAYRSRLSRLGAVFGLLSTRSWKLHFESFRLAQFFNLSFRYDWVFTAARRLREEIPVLSERSIEKTLSAPRGLYVGPTGKLILRDPFHWWQYSIDLPGEVEFSIIPEPLEDHRHDITAHALGLTGTRKGRAGEREDRFDTRPYYPGDDIRHLHWKLFAHTGDLILRKADPAPPPYHRYFILIDPWLPEEGEQGLRQIDGLVGLLLGWLETTRDPEIDVELCGPDFSWTSADPLRTLERWLAGLTPDRAGKISEKNWPEGILVLAHPQAPRLRPYQERLMRLGARRLGPEEWR